MIRLTFRRPEYKSVPDGLQKLAEFDIYFPFMDGELKIVGGTVMNGEHDLFVNLPARAFGVGSERRYFEYIRDDKSNTLVKVLKGQIIQAFIEWSKEER